jgi:hypothetical protein
MAWVASAPALSNLLALSSRAQSPASVSPNLSQPQPTAKKATFKIHGWNHPGENEAKGDQVWIGINQSWRTAWR